jgi:hypothetical protein
VEQLHGFFSAFIHIAAIIMILTITGRGFILRPVSRQKEGTTNWKKR